MFSNTIHIPEVKSQEHHCCYQGGCRDTWKIDHISYRHEIDNGIVSARSGSQESTVCRGPLQGQPRWGPVMDLEISLFEILYVRFSYIAVCILASCCLV